MSNNYCINLETYSMKPSTNFIQIKKNNCWAEKNTNETGREKET